jgi:hypothetical protein
MTEEYPYPYVVKLQIKHRKPAGSNPNTPFSHRFVSTPNDEVMAIIRELQKDYDILVTPFSPFIRFATMALFILHLP